MSDTSTNPGTAGGIVEVLPARRRFSVAEYDRMVEAGILCEDDRVELINGEIFEMAAMGSRHATCIRLLNAWFITRLDGRAIVSSQSPVRLSSGSEPEPDLALLRLRPDLYAAAHPGPSDVLLLVEVADTPLTYDQGLKLPRYAEAGIPELWIVDLVADRVLRHAGPADGRYQNTSQAGRGDSLSPAAFPDLVLPVSDLLP